jgi:hypothetical protein
VARPFVAELEPPLSAAERLRVAFDLFDAGVAMHRMTLRRERPECSEAEIDDALDAWLATRPGAEDGDAPGRRVPWPRSAT